MITVFAFVGSLGFISKFIDGMIAVIDKRKKRMPEKKESTCLSPRNVLLHKRKPKS